MSQQPRAVQKRSTNAHMSRTGSGLADAPSATEQDAIDQLAERRGARAART
jgi:hypothetical protein